MRVLMLTWEFPPFITGGLGMACYGLARALLKQNVEIDLVLPTNEEVYFRLRHEDDVDILPIQSLDPTKRRRFSTQTRENLLMRLQSVGFSLYPESYVTPALHLEHIRRRLDRTFSTVMSETEEALQTILTYLEGSENLFRKVHEFTARVLKYAIVLNPELIHAHDWLTYPAGVGLKNVLGTRLVAHIHATEFDRAGGPGDERIHKIEYAGLSSADQIIAVSRYTARMIIDRYMIPSSKIQVVHNAYTLSKDYPIPRRRIFRDPLILFLGRITLQKGPDYFLEVAERVLRRFPKVRFVMAGTGDMFSRILKSSASRRLRSRFLFAGFLNREQVEDILSATDIFVLPSVSEPFGIVPLEAMAYGAAAIVSKQSGVSEIVQHVFKVDFWDVDRTVDIIIDLLENPEKRQEIASAGQQEVVAIGWQKAAEETSNLYRKTLCST